jgi:hypothetical protein
MLMDGDASCGGKSPNRLEMAPAYSNSARAGTAVDTPCKKVSRGLQAVDFGGIHGVWLEFGIFSTNDPRPAMSAPHHSDDHHATDPVDDVVPMMPIVLPIVGGVLMFLLAFIAVSMA